MSSTRSLRQLTKRAHINRAVIRSSDVDSELMRDQRTKNLTKRAVTIKYRRFAVYPALNKTPTSVAAAATESFNCLRHNSFLKNKFPKNGTVSNHRTFNIECRLWRSWEGMLRHNRTGRRLASCRHYGRPLCTKHDVWCSCSYHDSASC